jgi:hypothetical protein
VSELEKYKKLKGIFYAVHISFLVISIIVIISFIWVFVNIPEATFVSVTTIAISLMTFWFFGDGLINEIVTTKCLKKSINNVEDFIFYGMKYNGKSGATFPVVLIRNANTLSFENKKLGTFLRKYPKNSYQLAKESYLKKITKREKIILPTTEQKEKIVLGLAARFLPTNLLYKAYLELQLSGTKITHQLDDIWFYGYDQIQKISPKRKKILKKIAQKELKDSWDITNKMGVIGVLNSLKRGIEGVTFGFDLGRYANVMRVAIHAEYLTDKKEIDLYMEECYELLTKNFVNYGEFLDSYLMGVHQWNPQAIHSRTHQSMFILLNPESPANKYKW